MKLKIAIPIAIVAIALFVGWYEFRPERLFINKTVHQSFPTVEGNPAEETLASGTFHSVLHPTSGTATIYELPNGSRMLRFTNFRTSNGPDVHIYMVAASDAKDNDTVMKAGFVDLGPMKGNIGEQNYMLAPEMNLSKYRAVSVWCKRFSFNFGTAPLVPNQTLLQK